MADTTPITRAVEACGGNVRLAAVLNIDASLISQWKHGIRPVAAHHCIAIEAACKGAVTRHDLRPDVFGPAPSECRNAA